MPIIFLSAHIDADDQASARALGARACLSKPFDIEVLRALLRELAAQVRARPTTAARAGLLRLFAQQWPLMQAAIDDAMQACLATQTMTPHADLQPTLQTLRQALHAVRGSLAVLAQPELLGRTRALEEAVLAGRLPEAAAIAALLHDLTELAKLAPHPG